MTQRWLSDTIDRGYSALLPVFDPQTSGIGGDMGQENADFIVTEIPAYEPEGQGDHLYLYIEKEGATTLEVVRILQDAFDVKEVDVGYAGMKDKHAITRQWFSIYHPKEHTEGLESLRGHAWMRILEVSRHGNKLRTGHLRGNRFDVMLYGVEADDALVDARCRSLKERGFINYFGLQRFGYGGNNVSKALYLLKSGKRVKHKELKLLASSLQSAVFNLIAAQRVQEHGQNIFAGDVMRKVGGGCFICEDPEADQERVNEGSIVLTGALIGSEVMLGHGEGLAIETHSAHTLGIAWPDEKNAEGLPISRFGKFARGTRRNLWEHAQDIMWERKELDSICISFTLASGSYATVLLRQLCGDKFTR